MPYKVVSVNDGFKVKRKTRGAPRYYSKAPLTKEMANRQLRALYRAENIKMSGKGKCCCEMAPLSKMATQMFL